MNPKLFTLKNGLKVMLINTKVFSSLTTLLLVGAGSRFENEKNNGIAHFFEHMAFKGSKKYPNSLIISSTVDAFGGVFNAFTSKDHTGYWIKATNDHFETMVDVISDMVQTPILSPEEIEREKGVIVEEINMYEDTPQRKVGEVFEELLYKGSPLGYDIAGSRDTVTKFDRKTFTDYIKNLYFPNNSVFVVAGSITDEKKYLEIIEEKFSRWTSGDKINFSKISESQQAPQALIRHKRTEQAHLCLGFRSFSFNDERKYAMNLLSAILGGGMSSRLFIQVRERRGLCYYISSGSELYDDCGNFVTQAGVTNNIEKVKEAVKTILEEHKKITTGEISSKELKKAKEMIRGRLMLSMEDSMNIATYYGTKELLQNKIESPEEVLKKIDKVSASEVSELAKQVFIKKNLNFAIIGPFSKGDFESLLDI